MRILPLLIIAGSLCFGYLKPGHPHGPGFKISCSKCHSSKSWQLDREIYSFDHGTTRLPLKGQHAVINCRDCHKSLVFSEAKSACIDCHNDVHQATVGSDCSRCHNPESWLVNNINEIHSMSRFPLLGAHRTADCYTCHKSASLSRFDVQGINCIDCHQQDYVSTTSPNHAEAGFSEECSKCHPVNSFQWSGAGFSHSFFPLVQAHSTPLCADCHSSGRYSDARPDCNSCHNADYLAAANPNHITSDFPLTCSTCHNLNPGWRPANFDHSFFPLTLGHATPKCIDCHTGGNYNNTPTDCYSCHKTDYNGTTNPGHTTLNFSTVCTQCHTVNPGWKPAAFKQHDSQFFPVYSGRHNGTWNSCSTCHDNPGNYAQFTCLTCHEHNKSSMDREHSGRSGYSYTSSACYHCHPRGNADK